MEQPKIFRYDTVDSTNTVCKSLAAQGAPSGTAVIARRQTAGRGRMGRSFESPEGLGLYLSVLWRPEGTPEDLLPLTPMAAVHPTHHRRAGADQMAQRPGAGGAEAGGHSDGGVAVRQGSGPCGHRHRRQPAAAAR